MSGRKLTNGEKELARTMFGKAIDYDDITVFNKKINVLQPDNFNAAPDGNLYMIKDYCEDYSKSSVEAQASFLHEMTHVWQIQNNTRNLKTEAAIEVLKGMKKAKKLKEKFHYSITSRYLLSKGKDLNDYTFEQQAGIVEDYHRLKSKLPTVFNESSQQPDLGEYTIALHKLLKNPSYARRG